MAASASQSTGSGTSSGVAAAAGPKNMGWTGARRRQGRWAAELRMPQTRAKLWIGTFATPEEAALAYDAAVFCLYGARVPRTRRFNFPNAPRPNIPERIRARLTVTNIRAIAEKHARSLAVYFVPPPPVQLPAATAPPAPPMMEPVAVDAAAGLASFTANYGNMFVPPLVQLPAAAPPAPLMVEAVAVDAAAAGASMASSTAIHDNMFVPPLVQLPAAAPPARLMVEAVSVDAAAGIASSAANHGNMFVPPPVHQLPAAAPLAPLMVEAMTVNPAAGIASSTANHGNMFVMPSMPQLPAAAPPAPLMVEAVAVDAIAADASIASSTTANHGNMNAAMDVHGGACGLTFDDPVPFFDPEEFDFDTMMADV